MDYLLPALVLSVGINLLMFVPAYLFKTDKLTDISYAVTFAVVAFYSFASSSADFAHLLLLFMVLVWSARLGGFLLYRIQKTGKDNRFDQMRGNFWKFLRFWILQGLTVFVVMLASLLVWSSDTAGLPLVSAIGVDIFLIGLFMESIADWQKFKFKQSGGKNWIDTGLWRVSRHPNYLGEIMVWTGVFIFALPILQGGQIVYAALSPIYISALLLFVSGVPILEKQANEKWGSDREYKKYKEEVPLLLPTLSSLKRIVKK